MQRGTILTSKQALDLVHEVVKEAGMDYIDPRSADAKTPCRYVVDGAPACLVGRVLAKAGWDLDALKALDEHGGGLGMNASEIRRHHSDIIGYDAAGVLERVQYVQDSGKSWGDALAEAILFDEA